MKSPFISIKAIIIGAAIFCAIIIGANVFSNFMPQSPIIYTATSTTSSPTLIHATVHTATSTTQTSPYSSPPSLSISITPTNIIEGDPVMITIHDGSSTTDSVTNIKTATLVAPGPNATGASATTPLHFLTYKNIPTAFYGTGINQTPGTATVTVIIKNDGQNGSSTTKLSGTFTITKRVSPTESLPVPTALGGNSTSSQETLVANLDAENVELAQVYSNPSTSFWVSAFAFPIHASDVPSTNGSPSGIVVTDPFGYNRDSGAETIVHKGTDFKAPPGTPVYAINAGYVRVAKLFTVYGNTVIVDHGMGIESFYMHLTKWVVTPGEPVKKGQLLGYSGETGYSEGPHLHLTIRVGGVSIDPMKFYALFGVTL